MEHSVDTLTAPDSRAETPELTLVEQKIANLYNVISSDHDYLIGPEVKRTEFKEVLSKVHEDIDDTFSLDIEASKVHQDVDLMVAKCFDVAVREKFELIKTKEKEAEITKETNALIGIVFNPPVGLVASKPQIDEWHNEALNVQKEVRSKPGSNQKSTEQIVADSYSRVAAAYGAGIAAAKNGKQIIESGDDYKWEWVESQRKNALGKDPDSKATFDAINRISVIAYSTELNDPNALIDKVKSLTRKAVAGVALAGVISTMSSVVANADTGSKTTEIVPDSTKKADKQINPDEKVSIKTDQSLQETKKETEAPVEDKQDIKKDTLIPPKPDKKPDTKNLEHAIIIPEELVVEPVKAPTTTSGNEKNETTDKDKSKSELDDSKKSDQDKPTETPKSESPSGDQVLEKEKDAKDHAILIDPSHLSGEDDKGNSEDKAQDNDDIAVEPIVDQAPKDKIKDQVSEDVVTIVDGVIGIDEKELDSEPESEKDNDHEEAPEDDKDDTPKVIDGVLTLDPEDLGEDKSTDEEVLISPSFEIPKPQIIEIPTHKQETPKQEQGPATPQQDFSHASDKMAGRGGVWERRGIAMKFFIEDPELAMTPSMAAGLLGNLLGENGADLNPGRNQYGGPAFGIAQWEGGRLLDLGAFAGTNQADFMTQLQFIKYELLGKERGAFNMLKTATNRAEAAVIVRKYYERPSVHRDEERIAYANEVGDAFNAEYQAILSSRAPKQETNNNGILAGWPTTGEAAMKLFNQCDPRWGEIRTPNGVRACDVSCGPTAVAMAVNALTGREVNPGEVIKFTNDNRMWLPGDQGTSFNAAINLGKNFGINGTQMQNFKDINAYREILKNGGMILVAGSGPAPFVAPSVGAHFVLIRGITEDGKFLVADPYPKTPDTNTGAWDAQPILNGTFGAVVFTK